MDISAVVYNDCSLAAGIKYCADITCYNGGTCKNRVKNDSICECTKDFTGIDCGTSEFYWH